MSGVAATSLATACLDLTAAGLPNFAAGFDLLGAGMTSFAGTLALSFVRAAAGAGVTYSGSLFASAFTTFAFLLSIAFRF